MSPKSTQTHMYDGASLDALAKLELDRLAGVPISVKASNAICEVYNVPACVDLHMEKIPLYFRPFINLPQTSFTSYNLLRHGMQQTIEELRRRTPCTYKLTYLLNGIYFGEARELHGLWNGAEKTVAQLKDGLGKKVASVKFATEAFGFIEF